MKKALFLILALVMCLSLIPMTALAYGNDKIQLDKSNYDPNEAMVVTVKGITQKMVDDWACIGIFKKGASESIGNYPQINNTGENVIDYMTAPVEPGEYAVVLLSKWWQNGTFEELFVTSLPFTVGKIAKEGQISLDKTAYTAMDEIVVTYTGITEQMVNAKAFVRIHEKGTGQTSYGGRVVGLGSGHLTLDAPNKNGEFEVRLYSVDDGNWNATAEYIVMSVSFTVSGASDTSGWADEQEIARKATEYGLIPDSLKGADWTKPITRAEFAAVAVKLYENLTGKVATPVSPNQFTDTNDPEVLKAVNVGVTNGTSDTTFSPNDRLTREQMAAMLTRALKSAYIDGWTLATDSQYTLNFTMPAKFADDALISGYARESVYFMFANKIINGTGNNNFSPKAASTSTQAINAATATREQSLAIAVRIVENLKDKPLGFSKSS